MTTEQRSKIDVDALKRERDRLLKEARDILNLANGEDRDLEPDEQLRYNELTVAVTARNNQIKREEFLQGEEDRYQGLGTPMRPDPQDDPTRVGLSREDIQGYSMFRAIRAVLNQDWRDAPLEKQASEQIAKRLGKQTRSNAFFLPYEVTRNYLPAEKRDITIGTEGTDIMMTDFGSLIDLLRNRSRCIQAGARVLTGLRGDLQYPKLTAAAVGGWVAEGGAPSESTQTFGQVKLVPKQLSAFTDLTRQTLLQSSFDVERAIRDDLATVLSIEFDRAALHGSGASNQPTGIASQAGVNVVALGANGAAPTWANILQLEEEVAIDNADEGRLGHITNPKVRRKLKTTERATNTGIFVWNDLAPYGTPTTPLNGYTALITNQVSSTLTKGTSGAVCSAIFFGNWEELLMGIWSDVEILVDPYTASTTGTVRIVALMNADIAVRHGESFAVILDALTT